LRSFARSVCQQAPDYAESEGKTAQQTRQIGQRLGFLTSWRGTLRFAQQEGAVERRREEVEPDLLAVRHLLSACDQKLAAEPARPAVDETGQVSVEEGRVLEIVEDEERIGAARNASDQSVRLGPLARIDRFRASGRLVGIFGLSFQKAICPVGPA